MAAPTHTVAKRNGPPRRNERLISIAWNDPRWGCWCLDPAQLAPFCLAHPRMNTEHLFVGSSVCCTFSPLLGSERP